MSNTSNVKMFLFARWISTCYAYEHMDENNRSQYDEGYDRSIAISVLNREDGSWWRDKLRHFNSVVYPNYLKNGSVKNTELFLSIKKDR